MTFQNGPKYLQLMPANGSTTSANITENLRILNTRAPEQLQSKFVAAVLPLTEQSKLQQRYFNTYK